MTLKILAEVTGEHRRMILARLRKSGIQPFSSGGRVFGHLYLREEVERAFPL
ncbi:hypothetical protein [Rhodovulum steppense]|uniref:hypothetical protein n=1 Tax=Rhodovulum steppense TaxID=540251 RepID=UPI00140457E3|nr:hypothetical protein [Rhodovulum steppense]